MFKEDTFPPAPLALSLTFISHSTLMIRWGDTVIHVDPVSEYADYTDMPKAGVVLVTHDHSDHCDPTAIAAVRTADTAVLVGPKCGGKVQGSVVMKNGDARVVKGIGVQAVPAYNIVHMRSPGVPFHAKGDGNGYILTLGTRKLYVAGDTENTPEMKGLSGIDIAFLPMNLPYTMTPEMVADAALSFRPKILYPYHCGNTDTAVLEKLMTAARDIEVRLRGMK